MASSALAGAGAVLAAVATGAATTSRWTGDSVLNLVGAGDFLAGSVYLAASAFLVDSGAFSGVLVADSGALDFGTFISSLTGIFSSGALTGSGFLTSGALAVVSGFFSSGALTGSGFFSSTTSASGSTVFSKGDLTGSGFFSSLTLTASGSWIFSLTGSGFYSS